MRSAPQSLTLHCDEGEPARAPQAEPRMKWIPDTGPFVAALDEVHLAFQEVIGTEVQGVVAEQDRVADRLRQVEKQTAAVVAQISKQISKADMSAMAREAAELEQTLDAVESKLDSCVDSILRIDQKLPAKDRLIAHGLPNNTKYELLHEKISSRSLAKSPERLHVQQARPETQVNVDYATSPIATQGGGRGRDGSSS